MRKSKKNRTTKNKTRKNRSKYIYTDEARRLMKIIKELKKINKTKTKTMKKK
jgi:hypothetical protein